MKKLSLSVKLTIILVIAAIVFLSLSIASAGYSVRQTVTAIENIGKVTYDEAGKSKIDAAITYYNALDTNIKLDKKVSNYDDLIAAKAEYVRLAIKKAVVSDQRKVADNLSVEEIAVLLKEAREALETYLTEEQYELVENYGELTALEENNVYQPLLTGEIQGSSDSSQNSTEKEETAGEPEIC